MANQGAKKRKEENSFSSQLFSVVFNLLLLELLFQMWTQKILVSRITVLLNVLGKDISTAHLEILDFIFQTLNVQVIYVIVRSLIFHSSVSWKHFVGLLVTSAAYALSYKQLAQMAEPSYDDDGELLDGGYDMSTGGICSYLHDVIYITSFVQVMSILSGKFLVHIPGGHYKLINLEYTTWHDAQFEYCYRGFISVKKGSCHRVAMRRPCTVTSPQCALGNPGSSSLRNISFGGPNGICFEVREIDLNNYFLVIPAFAAYKLSGLAKGFLSHDSEGVPEDEKTRKKREKLEKKASRPKFVRTRSK
ncbi:hypothetical protein C5167_021828 [Papaver somniferum]|uniref:Uncharacterized protein n=1 Tax=Papaver somniferum TaxID=3469 RepID=A0A4Y7JH31_PAPSO|nr:hypothetical protein C5167_021828 [Papaver somniferum]